MAAEAFSARSGFLECSNPTSASHTGLTYGTLDIILISQHTRKKEKNFCPRSGGGHIGGASGESLGDDPRREAELFGRLPPHPFRHLCSHPTLGSILEEWRRSNFTVESAMSSRHARSRCTTTRKPTTGRAPVPSVREASSPAARSSHGASTCRTGLQEPCVRAPPGRTDSHPLTRAHLYRRHQPPTAPLHPYFLGLFGNTESGRLLQHCDDTHLDFSSSTCFVVTLRHPFGTTLHRHMACVAAP